MPASLGPASSASFSSSTPSTTSTPSPPSSPAPAPARAFQYVHAFQYVKVVDAQRAQTELTAQLGALGALGRVFVHDTGINVQMVAPVDAVPACELVLRSVADGSFRELKLWAGAHIPADVPLPFAGLRVRLRRMLNEGPPALAEALHAHVDAVTRLSPRAWHDALAAALQRQAAKGVTDVTGGTGVAGATDVAGMAADPAAPVVLDVRNLYEFEVGSFLGARPVETDAFRHTFKELDTILGLASSTATPTPADTPGAVLSSPSVPVPSPPVRDPSLRSASASTPADSTATPEAATASDTPAPSASARFLPPLAPHTVSPDRPLMLFCTGGIRCETAGAYLRSRGFRSVSVLDGGINAYLEFAQRELPQPERDSLFRGRSTMFDGRRGVRATADVIARCFQCGAACDTQVNCDHAPCDALLVQCPACARAYQGCCSAACLHQAKGQSVDVSLLPVGTPVVATAPAKGARVRPRYVPLTRPADLPLPPALQGQSGQSGQSGPQ